MMRRFVLEEPEVPLGDSSDAERRAALVAEAVCLVPLRVRGADARWWRN